MKVLHVGCGFRPWRIGGLIEYAEDLMDVQVSHGYKVGYFFFGRCYPFFKQPWLKKWIRRDIRMFEVINSPVALKSAQTPEYPEVDLNEEYSEKSFLSVLSEFKPDIVHIQELYGLPSSLIELIKLKNIPVLMTLHDYFTLCPILKLFDYNKSLCLKPDVGNTCKICYSQESRSPLFLVETTLNYESQKSWLIKSLITIANQIRRSKHFLYLFLPSFRSQRSTANSDHDPIENNLNCDEGRGSIFQMRRDTNIERLNKIDLLVSQSFRTAEVYRTLGVQDEKVITIHSSVKHLEWIRPKTMASIPYPINIATMNGLAATSKGAYLILNTLHKLKESGLTDQFKLFVMGHILDDIRDELLQFSNVIYKGVYDVSNLNSLLEEIHIGIVPSIWEEVYGYVGIEFLAKGIPVIGNKIGGIVDYTIDNFTGWLNRTNTSEELTQIIIDIINHPQQILRLNQNINSNYHQIIKSTGIHFEEMNKVYTELIQAKQKQQIEV